MKTYKLNNKICPIRSKGLWSDFCKCMKALGHDPREVLQNLVARHLVTWESEAKRLKR